MEFWGRFFETFLEGSVGHISYTDYIVNWHFFYLLQSGLLQRKEEGSVVPRVKWCAWSG